MKSHSKSLTFVLAGSLVVGLALQSAQAQKPEEVAKILQGRWSTSSTDKETGITETTMIEFRADGRYVTAVRDSAFKPLKDQQSNQGRYSIGKADKSGFELKIERDQKEPESDKTDASETSVIKIVDDNTLQAADGSVVKRMR